MFSEFCFIIGDLHCFAPNVAIDPGVREANSGELQSACSL